MSASSYSSRYFSQGPRFFKFTTGACFRHQALSLSIIPVPMSHRCLKYSVSRMEHYSVTKLFVSTRAKILLTYLLFYYNRYEAKWLHICFTLIKSSGSSVHVVQRSRPSIVRHDLANNVWIPGLSCSMIGDDDSGKLKSNWNCKVHRCWRASWWFQHVEASENCFIKEWGYSGGFATLHKVSGTPWLWAQNVWKSENVWYHPSFLQ